MGTIIQYLKTELHYCHHNFDERRYHKVRHLTNTIVDHTGSLLYIWILTLIYVFFIFNYTNDSGINVITITKATGYTADISPLLRLRFWPPVYYKVYNSDFLSHSTRKCGQWVDSTKHIGHAMTLMVLTDYNQKRFFWSLFWWGTNGIQYFPWISLWEAIVTL